MFEEHQSPEDWYETWFDTPYYHILYHQHNTQEAQHFVRNIAQFLPILPQYKVLDLGCGRGRHAVYINALGAEVVGIDLSVNNIEYARQFQNERLHFHVHDMRQPFSPESFDVVVNLFTSFGYFDTHEENQQAISAAARNLKPGGKLILDFFNTPRIVRTLRPRYTQTVEGIDFHIKKKYANGFIWKMIRFRDKGKNYVFQERVMALQAFDLLQYFKKAGLKILSILGDYNLHSFDMQQSDRLILIGEKSA
jgi:SAM-dependent methyltransferase